MERYVSISWFLPNKNIPTLLQPAVTILADHPDLDLRLFGDQVGRNDDPTFSPVLVGDEHVAMGVTVVTIVQVDNDRLHIV